MSKKLLLLTCVVLMVCLGTAKNARSQGTYIEVVNYSFELGSDCNDDCQVTEHTGDLGLGWEMFGKWMGQDVICDDPDPYDYYSYFCKPWLPSDGTVMAYMQTNDIYCWQMLDETVAPDTMYTLTIDALTFDPDVKLTASLIYQKGSGTPVEIASRTIALEQIKTYDQSLAEWSEYSVSLVVPQGEKSVGRTLGIKFFAHTGQDDWRWIFLDNVRVRAKIATDAYNPSPLDNSVSVDPATEQLSFSPGLWAAKHNVYFSDNFDQVNDRLPDALIAYNIDANSVPIPMDLQLGCRYFWAVDEVNDSYSGSTPPPWPGPVWTFKVNDGKASDPAPQYGAESIDPSVVLSWSPGIFAAYHDVYLGTDSEEVSNADITSDTYKGRVDINSFDPDGDIPGTHYYWRIDEINDAHPDYLWKGNTWAFAVPAIIYVDDDATGNNNGSNWANAFNCLQDAMADAKEQDEIRVAQGIYKPDQGADNIPGDRKAAFFLKDKMTIKGGYAGFGQPDPDARHIQLYETVLSGDLSSNDAHNIPVQDLLDDPTRAENSFHVVVAINPDTDLTSTAVDGFTITAGNANLPVLPPENWPHFEGGGMYLLWASPKIINCKITENSADRHGGGMISWGSSPQIIACTFTKNLADQGAGLDLGQKGFELDEPIVTKSIFSDNMARQSGGAIMLNNMTDATVRNSLIARNSARYDGGGIACFYSGNSTIVNCTITDNDVPFGSGGGIVSTDEGLTTITNCIVWGNQASNYGPQIALGYENNASVSYCDVQGGQDDVYVSAGSVLDWGKANIDADPLFIAPATGDYHLDYLSPCIDVGKPGNYQEQTDIDGDPRVIEDRVDIGADEFSVAAVTKAYSPDPPDGAVDVPQDVTLTWTAGIDAASHDVYFGTDETAVENATTASLEYMGNTDVNSYPLALLELGTAYYWRIDEVNGLDLWKGNVWNFTVEGRASAPVPADGAQGVDVYPVLMWNPGIGADTHNVYFGTDETAVENATVISDEFMDNIDVNNYVLGPLEIDTTYYWRIDEVNNALARVIKGDIWRFKTCDYIVIDDFESYDHYTNPIWDTWLDGWTNDTRAEVFLEEGDPNLTFGSQSMRYHYSNYYYPYYSEAEALTDDLQIGSDWTTGGVQTLSLWFYGDAENDLELMWLALEDGTGHVAEFLYNGNINDIKLEQWQQWNIPLQQFADQGLDLTDVIKISIIFGFEEDPQLYGEGYVFFDNIALNP